MYLFIDFEKERQEVILVERRENRRFAAANGRGGFSLLKKIIDGELGSKKPEVIFVQTGFEGRDVSWSSVRSAVAIANALAFSWNVPVAAVTRKIADGDLFTFFQSYAAGVTAGKWIRPTYSGEPNITQPRASPTV